MSSKSIFVALLAGLLWIAPSAGFSQDYKLGVLSPRGAAQANKEWKATADYLTAKTGKTFTIVPLEYSQIPTWAKEKKVDFFYTSPAMYVELNKLYGAEAIVTQTGQFKGEPLTRYASVIVVKQDGPIQKLSDLKGKNIACASKAAFAGWQMASRLLLENGLDPDKDIASVREVKTYDNAVFAVHNGAVPAAFIRTGILEKMAQEGTIKAADFTVLHPVSDDFPIPHSTQLYPESPIAACKHIPEEFRNKVSRALQNLKPTDAPSVDLKIYGWTEPLDYRPVVECLTIIKYGIFKDEVLPPKAAAPAAAVESAQVAAPAAQPSADSGQAKAQARGSKGRTSIP